MQQQIEEIKAQFKQVISWSQGIPEPKVDELFNEWFEAKRHFIRNFGEKFIVELPHKVSFPLSTEERDARLNDFISEIENNYDNVPLANFVSDNRRDFFSNIMTADYSCPECKVKRGSKIIKAFKHFEDDKVALENIQNYASRLIQEDAIEGHLCLSVHPLDFLSASENNYNWRSCHALDGEYRSGNLSYMVDACTVMCYLRGDKEEQLPNFPETVPWNSKKWRVWIFFAEDGNMMFAGRQYPFELPAAINTVRTDLLRAAHLSSDQYQWTDWYVDKVDKIPFKPSTPASRWLYDKYVAVGHKLVGMNELICDVPGSNHFNDLLHSSCYNPIYSYKYHSADWYVPNPTGESDSFSTKFHLGGPVKCMRCGESKIALTEAMTCIECEEKYGSLDTDDFGYCACCERHIYLEDAYWVQDEPVCSYCYDTEVKRCGLCDSLYFKDELSFNREVDKMICPYCQENITDKHYRYRMSLDF